MSREPTTARIGAITVSRRAFNAIRDTALERELSFDEALRYIIDTGIRALRVGLRDEDDAP